MLFDLPPFGIGWGNAVGKNSRLTISVDAGVMFQGKPKVSLTPKDVNLSPADTALLQQNIDKEVENLKCDIKDFLYYPVISLGLAYKL